VTLHDELADILEERGNEWTTMDELATAVNQRGRYHKRDGSPMIRYQIVGRTYQYKHLFEIEGSRVRLKL
jgi:hypothetical protein